MGLKPGAAVRGMGEVLRLPADAGRSGGGVLPENADRLVAMDAAEAVATLEGADTAVQMPEARDFTFPGPIAEALYWSDADIVGIQGPVGSGKTTTVLKSRLRRAVMMPRSTIDGWRRYKLLVVRETYRQLWSTTIPSYLEVYPKAMGTWSGGRGDPVTHVIQFDDGHGPIEFRVEFMAFGDDVIASMRGVQTTDIWLNETDTVPVEVLTAGIGRIDRWPGAVHFEGYPPELRGYGQICCDFNAPDEDNWTFQVFHDADERQRMADFMTASLPEGARPIRIEFYNQPGYGQPGCENLQNLSASYYPRQIAAMRLAGRGDMIDRLVYNKIVYLRAGDPVFRREFNRRIHVAETTIEPERGVPLRIGLDQGFKGAAVVAQFLEPFHWLFLAELHFPAERLMAVTFGQRLADLLERRFPGFEAEGWGDMAGEHGASQAADENATWNKLVGETAGFRVRPQKVGTNRIQPRLEGMRAALEFIHGGRPGLLIDPSCKYLIRGFEARYVWTDEVDSSGDKRKVPDKRLTEANVMDAGQYVLLSESKPSGLSKFSFPGAAAAAPGTGPGSRRPQEAGGLSAGFDVFNPYGD
ncbi:hypothetical protein [Cereibacter azotoformans]|uniref:hypothetical protein n=1 Tax=Cereibacter azotoformans TaxID=43057 RepID=UPI001179EBAD|nr:hypothetical protein [Cereibacter azotoformans]